MKTHTNIITLYTQDQRIDGTYPDTRREVLPHIVRHVALAPDGEGTILYSDLDETNVDEAIREQNCLLHRAGPRV